MKQALRADTDGSMHYRLGRWYQKNGQTRQAAEAFAVSTKLKAEKLKRDTERFTALQPADQSPTLVSFRIVSGPKVRVTRMTPPRIAAKGRVPGSA